MCRKIPGLFPVGEVLTYTACEFMFTYQKADKKYIRLTYVCNQGAEHILQVQ